MNFSNDFSPSQSANFAPSSAGMLGGAATNSSNQTITATGGGGGGRRKANIIRSQYTRPHTPSVCNRNNDTEEMKLADEIIRQRTEQRQTSLRALDWMRSSPRFKPKPPSKSSEAAVPCCDIGSERYLQDRATPSSRRKECTAFTAASRDAPFNGGSRGLSLSTEEAKGAAQISRLEHFCRSREELRLDAATKLSQAEAAVNVECRPEPSPRTPRASFLQFVHEMKLYQEAAEWMKKNEEHVDKNDDNGKKKAGDRDHETSRKDDDEEREEEMQKEEENHEIEVEHEDQRQENQQNKQYQQDPHLQKFFYGRLSDYDAVRRLQQHAASITRIRAGNTALRIRSEKSQSACDPTSYSHPVTPRQRTVRMIDPSLEHSSRSTRYRSASENEIDALAGGGTSSEDASGNPLGSGRSGTSNVGVGGGYCRQTFYNVPVEAFQHVPTPRMNPRVHSAQAVKKRNSIEHQRLITAGKIKSSSLSPPLLSDEGRRTDAAENVNANPRTKISALQQAIAKALKQQKETARSSSVVATYALADAPVIRKAQQKRRKRAAEEAAYGASNAAGNELACIGGDIDDDDDGHDINALYRQIDAHRSCGVRFERQSGRERRPLSAGAVAHTGFSAGLSVETLKGSDEATGRTPHMGCIPMKLPLHERRPAPQTKIQTFPRYDVVHNRPPSVAFGSPPSPRAPIVYGSPEKLPGRAATKIPSTVETSIRTLGALMSTRAVYDFREALNVDRGICMTHPKSIRDIKMPVMKKEKKKQTEITSDDQ